MLTAYYQGTSKSLEESIDLLVIWMRNIEKEKDNSIVRLKWRSIEGKKMEKVFLLKYNRKKNDFESKNGLKNNPQKDRNISLRKIII